VMASTFNKERLKLRELHKQLRVGLISWEEIPEDKRQLLCKYYGW
jgi:hypothetical protein